MPNRPANNTPDPSARQPRLRPTRAALAAALTLAATAAAQTASVQPPTASVKAPTASVRPPIAPAPIPTGSAAFIVNPATLDFTLKTPFGTSNIQTGTVIRNASSVVVSGHGFVGRGFGYFNPYYGYGRYRYRYGYGFGYGYPGYYYDRPDRYDPLFIDNATLIQLARRLDPDLIPQSEADDNDDTETEPINTRPLTKEAATEAMREGDFDDAAKIYAELADQQRRTETEDATNDDLKDRTFARLQGLAEAAAGNLETASATLAKAYEEDESLRRRPLRGNTYMPEDDLRRLVQKAVAHAHRAQTHDAWFAVAVLMQAEGRNDRAEEMIDRANAARGEQDMPDDAEAHTDLPDLSGLAEGSDAAAPGATG